MAYSHTTGNGILHRLFCQMLSTLPLCIHIYYPPRLPDVLIQMCFDTSRFDTSLFRTPVQFNWDSFNIIQYIKYYYIQYDWL